MPRYRSTFRVLLLLVSLMVTLTGATASTAAQPPAAGPPVALIAEAVPPAEGRLLSPALVPANEPSRDFVALPLPRGKGPEEGSLPPGNARAAPRPKTPSLPDPARDISIQAAVHTNFAGMGDTGWSPPDAQAAAGPQHVVQVVNQSWSIYNRSGQQQWTSTFQNWFGLTGSLFDPRVIYDIPSSRFIMSVDNNRTHVIVQVSQSSSAMGQWCWYNIEMPSGLFCGFAPTRCQQQLHILRG